MFQLRRRREAIDRSVVIPVLAGLSAPILLIFTLSRMTFRYRMGFYPLRDLCAFLGFGVLLLRQARSPIPLFAAAMSARLSPPR